MKQVILPLLLFFSVHSCTAAQAEEKVAAAHLSSIQDPDHPTRSVLIFLDDTEAYVHDDTNKELDHHFRPITHAAFLAIMQQAGPIKAGPILVSGSILHNLFREPKQYDKHPRLLNYFYRTFNPDDWIIREISEPKKRNAHMYCLIPAGYQGISKNSLKTLTSQDPLTELEYTLGLAIEHMKPIPAQSNQDLRTYFDALYNRYNQDNYLLLKNNTGQSFLQALRTLFIIKKEYENAQKASPAWIVYVNGHGAYDKTITALSLEEFEQLLFFLQTKITTIVLVYDSCDAAGFNAQKIYGDLIDKNPVTTFSFAIIILGLPDMDVYGPKTTIKNNTITSDVSFSLFTAKLLTNSNKYADAIAHIVPKHLTAIIALIRPPHAPNFFPISISDKSSIHITKTMALTRTEELYVDPSKVDAVLLSTDYVPFVIDRGGQPDVALISMLSGDALHVLDYMHDNLANFISVMSAKEYNARKTFFIKTMTQDAAPTVTRLIIDYKPGQKPVFYFTQDGQQKTYDYSDKQIKSYQGDYIEDYRKLLLSFPGPNETHHKAGALKELGNTVKRGQDRLFKTIQLMRIRLYPELSFAGRRNLRYILEHVAKKEPGALDLFKSIIEKLVHNQKQEAQDFTQEAYGGSHNWGSDFPATHLDHKKWLDILMHAVQSADFSFLDAYIPDQAEEKEWRSKQRTSEQEMRELDAYLLDPAHRASTI